MTRQLTSKKLVLASHNKGKLQEIAELLKPYDIEVLSSSYLNLPDIEETGTSFVENAKLKALAVAKASNLPALADDSGLEVHALDNRPGIFSARFVENGDYYKAMEKLYKEALAKSSLTANFTCALAIAYPDGETQTFEGKVFGSLSWPPQGTNGFGYDPFFIPEGFDKSFGVLPKEIKQEISHRSKALHKFIKACLPI